jgi:eukaryotic-like serine/threonine-protein kinase
MARGRTNVDALWTSCTASRDRDLGYDAFGMRGVLAGRYEVEAHVGAGGMGEVFRARDRLLGDVVALKLLKPQDGPHAEAVERFRQEVRLARRVTHRNVARVFDLVDAEDGRLMLTMEFVDGTTLLRLMKQGGPLGIARAARVGVDVCAGLSAVHSVGIVHRDLKPANILVEHTGRVVLTDFGVARSWLEALSGGAGLIVGTPRYMAPEQAEGRPVGPRADLFALGVTLYEAACGHGSPLGEARARLTELDRAGTFCGVVMRCLEWEPDARPASASDVERALASIVLAGEPLPAPRSARADDPGHPTVAVVPATSVSSRAAPAPGSPGPGEAAGSVAVLPLRQLGRRHEDGAALVELVANQIVDTLCSARCVKVLAAGLTQAYTDSRDPLRVGRETGATELVDATLLVDSGRISVTARLVETARGEQLWAQTFDASVDELLSIERPLAKRVAEGVRAATLLHVLGRGVAPEAMRGYKNARAGRSGAEALHALERALEIAPTFAPALAAYALQCMQAWFIPVVQTPPRWGAHAASAIDRALAGAPMMPESHVASSLLAAGRGEGYSAVLALRCALDLAPTCPEALETLGALECEAGRPAPGVKRLELAAKIDPTRPEARVALARETALAGRAKEADEMLEALAAETASPPAFMLRLRIAAWNRDDRALQALATHSSGVSDPSRRVFYVELVGRGLVGAATRDEVEGHIDALLALPKDPRLSVGVLATAVEMAMRTGRREDALRHVRRLAQTPAFMDVGWLRRCPLLAELSDVPEYAEALRSAGVHAQSLMW